MDNEIQIHKQRQSVHRETSDVFECQRKLLIVRNVYVMQKLFIL